MYSLRRSKKILLQTYHQYSRKKNRLSPTSAEEIRLLLLQLQTAILQKEDELASTLATKAASLLPTQLKKTPFQQTTDFLGAIVFALAVAILVRQMWFEPYEIPTGSMRPTFKEQDRLVVSKTPFSLNLPLSVDHLYFDPDDVQRNGVVTFSGDHLPIPHNDTRYFYLFPGKKQYIKRLMGKPGDTLYFYGGLIYGIDRYGKDISAELQLEELSKIDHIPFLRFEGNISVNPTRTEGVYSPVVIHQMGSPIAALQALSRDRLQGRMLPLNQLHDSQFPSPQSYSELWGIGNFAMVRLLSKNEVETLDRIDTTKLPPASLYLELTHHPSLQDLMLIKDWQAHLRPSFRYSTSIIPLNDQQLHTLFSHLYTARFEVKKGKIYRYGLDTNEVDDHLPQVDHIEDGTYEFYYGKAYQIGWLGVTQELLPNHPIYTFSADLIKMWFNLGIECNTLFSPENNHPLLHPSRYAYFRSGDLYVMGSPLLDKNDPTLLDFLEREKTQPRPFIDQGPPLLADGSINCDLIGTCGLKIPSDMYLVLGDNHAMSGDSRSFGFVPQGNLRGAPSFIFWPPGERWGAPNQPSYLWVTVGSLVMWSTCALCIGGWFFWYRRRSHLPLKGL